MRLTDYYILEIYYDSIIYMHSKLNNGNSITRNLKSHAIRDMPIPMIYIEATD